MTFEIIHASREIVRFVIVSCFDVFRTVSRSIAAAGEMN